MLNTLTKDFGLMSLKDFAKAIKKPESTIRTWKRRGNIPADCFLSIGSTIFVIVSKFEQLVKEGGHFDC